MNLIDTIKDSLIERFYPAGWNLSHVDGCVGEPDTVCMRQPHWHPGFAPVECASLADFDVLIISSRSPALCASHTI